MFSWRDLVIFLAGAEAFHTFSHVYLAYSKLLPLNMGFMVFTSTHNTIAIVINALITVGLLWLATRMSKA